MVVNSFLEDLEGRMRLKSLEVSSMCRKKKEEQMCEGE